MERELYLSILFDYYHTMLTDRQREIFDLYYNGLSYKKISNFRFFILAKRVRLSLAKNTKDY